MAAPDRLPDRPADPARLSRRGLGALLGAPVLGAALAACGREGGGPSGDASGLPGGEQSPPPSTPSTVPGSDVMTPTRVSYGDDDAQYADLYRPPAHLLDGQAASRGVVVVIHGGFWRDSYDATLGAPLALSLAEHGWTAWNLEYRRVGGGGGYPATLDDVAAGIDALADLERSAGVTLSDTELSRVITLGHSAGGHLAVWAATRGRHDAWAPERIGLAGAVAQAGVLAFDDALATPSCREGVLGLMGGEPDELPEEYLRADPLRQVPAPVPVRCVHGDADTIVPPRQSRLYAETANEAGGDVEVIDVAGDHFVVIDPVSEAWFRTLEVLDGLIA